MNHGGAETLELSCFSTAPRNPAPPLNGIRWRFTRNLESLGLRFSVASPKLVPHALTGQTPLRPRRSLWLIARHDAATSTTDQDAIIKVHDAALKYGKYSGNALNGGSVDSHGRHLPADPTYNGAAHRTERHLVPSLHRSYRGHPCVLLLSPA